MINFLLWVALGGVIGWLAGLLRGTSARIRLAFDVPIGMAGAFAGGVFFGGATLGGNSVNEGALIVALAGATIASALSIVFRRRLVH